MFLAISSTPEHGGASSRVCLQGTAPVIRRMHTQYSLESTGRTRICIIYCFHHIPPKTLCLLCLEVKLQTQQPEAGGAPGWDVPVLRDLMEANTPFSQSHPKELCSTDGKKITFILQHIAPLSCFSYDFTCIQNTISGRSNLNFISPWLSKFHEVILSLSAGRY